MHEIKCGEIWGGISSTQTDVTAGTIKASVFSDAHESIEGGDIYYLSVCDSGLLVRIALVDVMGHGVSAAKTSDRLYQSLESHMNHLDSALVLNDLNQVARDIGFSALSTAIVVGYYPETNTLYCTNAGHHPVLIYHSTTDTWAAMEMPSQHLPLGAQANHTYKQWSTDLNSGDLFLLYTDGLIEAEDSQGSQISEAGLLKLLNTGPKDAKKLGQHLADALLDHTGVKPAHDDITYIVAEI